MIGTVLSEVRTVKVLDACRDQKWIVVKCQEKVVEAADLVGTELGQRVLIVPGKAAAKLCMGCCAEFAAVAVLEEREKDG